MSSMSRLLFVVCVEHDGEVFRIVSARRATIHERRRTVRLPDAEWEALDELAADRKTTPHGAMREAIVQWLARMGAKQLETKAHAKKARVESAQRVVRTHEKTLRKLAK